MRKGFYEFVLKRCLYLVIVLFATLFITLALMGPTFDKVLKGTIVDAVTEEVNKNPRLNSLQLSERQSIINTLVAERMHNQGLDEPWYSPKRLYNEIARVMILDLGRYLKYT